MVYRLECLEFAILSVPLVFNAMCLKLSETEVAREKRVERFTVDALWL